ncbi:MAG TPA: class I SAM-dependent methyltransferase [Gaiellaceae bacterium]|nr:class I SAM-dependent methyltransferase [Gaiellaceae bacterium]
MVSWNDSAAAPAEVESRTDPLSAFLDFAGVIGLPRTTGRALQLGFGGSSGSLETVASRFREYVGVDPDAFAVQRARRCASGRWSGAHFFVGTDVPDAADGDFDLIVCNFRRIPAGRDVLRRMGALVRLLAPGGIALFDVPRRRRRLHFQRGGATGSVGISWQDAARAASLAQARIMWVDKSRRGDTLYCVVRDR